MPLAMRRERPRRALAGRASEAHIRLVDDPVPLEPKASRLKSLDEFRPPNWRGLFDEADADSKPLGPIIGAGLIIGAALGMLLIW